MVQLILFFSLSCVQSDVAVKLACLRPEQILSEVCTFQNHM